MIYIYILVFFVDFLLRINQNSRLIVSVYILVWIFIQTRESIFNETHTGLTLHNSNHEIVYYSSPIFCMFACMWGFSSCCCCCCVYNFFFLYSSFSVVLKSLTNCTVPYRAIVEWRFLRLLLQKIFGVSCFHFSSKIISDLYFYTIFFNSICTI